MKRILFLALMIVSVGASAQTLVNPSQINWPASSGPSLPTNYCPTTATASTVAASSQLIVTSATGILPSQSVSGAGITAGTLVSSVNASTLTVILSQNATATATGVSLTFTSVGMPFTLTSTSPNAQYTCGTTGWFTGGGGGGGNPVQANGTAVSGSVSNFNNTTPAATSGNQNVLWQTDGAGHISAQVPTDSGGGTVTSVALVGSANLFSSTPGTAVTTSGNLNLDSQLLTQVANCILAGPSSGSNAAPTCRSLVAADLPAVAGVAGAYTCVNVTIDGHGRVTAAANGTCSGGGSLPTATAPGQIISSTGAGTTYAVQGGLFYQQSGDTISSIETECSSPCTYVVTSPQTITLGASHALNANVNLQFMAHGSWTINGSGFTLTIPGNVSGTLNQHFVAGSGSVAFGNTQAQAPVEWFGAVNDWNGSTGTDNTTAIQTCLNLAITCTFQVGGYEITSALSVSKANVGLAGAVAGSTAFPYGGSVSGTYLITTSASADIIDFAGASGNYINHNTVKRIAFERSVPPSGSATGLSFSYVAGATVSQTQSMDSITGYYIKAVPGLWVGSFDYNVASWGYGLPGNSYPTTVTGWALDTSGATQLDSFQMNHNSADNADSNMASSSTGISLTGTNISDVMSDDFETSNYVGTGINITPSGTTNFTAGDVHFTHAVLDQCRVNCILVDNVIASTYGAVELNGWFNEGVGGSGCAVQLTNSVGVTVTASQIYGITDAVCIRNSTVSLTGNTLYTKVTGGTGYGILLNSATSGSITGNTITGNGATALIGLVDSSYYAIAGNSLLGSASVGISFDSSSNYNTAGNLNTINPASITTPINDSGTGNELPGGCSGVTPGSYTSANITVNSSGCVTAAANGSGASNPSVQQTFATQINALSTEVHSTNSATVGSFTMQTGDVFYAACQSADSSAPFSMSSTGTIGWTDVGGVNLVSGGTVDSFMSTTPIGAGSYSVTCTTSGSPGYLYLAVVQFRPTPGGVLSFYNGSTYAAPTSGTSMTSAAFSLSSNTVSLAYFFTGGGGTFTPGNIGGMTATLIPSCCQGEIAQSVGAQINATATASLATSASWAVSVLNMLWTPVLVGTPSTLFSQLPGSPYIGQSASITDASGTPSWGTTASGSGTAANSTTFKVMWNGSNWIYQ
jgi:hypothetical protein